MANSSKAIIVIGMHRSGTSALSGELAHFGVFMGKQLYQAQKGVNDKGFWENAKLVELNEALFDQANTVWDDPTFLLRTASYSSEQQSLARELLESEYGSAALWGMKDPRVSVLLPLWQPLLEQSRSEVNYLLMLRNPFEVAGSLSHRDSFSEAKGLMLWLNYNLMAYRCTTQQRRLIVDFADLLADPLQVREDISRCFDLQLAEQAQESFIEKNLKRQNQAHSEQGGLLAELAEQVYQALKQDDAVAIDQLYQRYMQYLQSLDPVLVEHLQQVQASETHFRTVFEKAYYSWWWKATWPFRRLDKLLKRRS